MAANCSVSIGVCRARFTKVDAAGNVIAGAANSYVTDSIAEATIAVNKETGTSLSVRNGCGCKIASRKFPDTFNWFDLTLTFRQLEPEMEALMLGAETIVDGADTVGLAFPSTIACDEDEPSVAVELWSENIVGSAQDGTYPWVHWVFPRATLSPGDATLGENNADRIFTGATGTNQQWGDGPYGDGPPDGQDIREGGYWKTNDDPPSAACVGGNVTATS